MKLVTSSVKHTAPWLLLNGDTVKTYPTDKTLLPIAVSGAHIPVHTTLGDGFREICFYTTDYDQFMEDLNQCLDPLPRLPIGIEYDSDPEWVYALRLREIAMDGGDDSCINVQLAA